MMEFCMQQDESGVFFASHGAERGHWRIQILLYTLHREYTVRSFSTQRNKLA
jgi:hypothetical protein